MMNDLRNYTSKFNLIPSLEMDYLREIVEEQEESAHITSTDDLDNSVIAVRQMSIESVGHHDLKNELYSATSLELKTTSTSVAAVPVSPIPIKSGGECDDNLVGLDLDEPDSVPPSTNNNVKTLSDKFINEFPVHSEIDTNAIATTLPPPSEQESENSEKRIAAQITKVELKIGPQHFELIKLLGEGAFGKVILVQSRLNKEFYAMKVISKRLLRKKNNVAYMKSERDILTKVNHPFLVSLCFAFQSQTKLFLVMDFLSGGELFLHLRKRGIILEKEVQFYLGEMIIAIDFLHGKGIVHRDLKPENVLLRKDGHVCITDFGLAKEIGDGKATRTLCGTSEYMAPEMLTRNGYGKAVDWWALGALCYEMLVGKPPFSAKTQKELDKKILSEKISTPSYLTAAAHSLLRGMLDKDMNKRLGCAKSTMFTIGGVSALKQHAFFDGLNWQRLATADIVPPIDLRTTNYNGPTLVMKQTIKQEAGNVLPNSKKTEPSALSITAKQTLPEDVRMESETAENKAIDDRIINSNEVSNPFSTQNVINKPNIEQKVVEQDDFVLNLRYFAAEFTTQVLSRSLIEDTLTPMTGTTAAHSPRAESPVGEDEFVNFDYIDESVTYSQQQIHEFEELFKIKQQKATKKKLLKQKKDECKLKEEEARKKELEEAQRKLQQENQEKAILERQQQVRQQLLAKKAAREKKKVELEQEKARLLSQKQQAQENLIVHQKKIKTLSKKIRDIHELRDKCQAKGCPLDKDQQLKLSKEPGLVQELEKLQCEETGLREGCDTVNSVLTEFEKREVATLEALRLEEEFDLKEVEFAGYGNANVLKDGKDISSQSSILPSMEEKFSDPLKEVKVVPSILSQPQKPQIPAKDSHPNALIAASKVPSPATTQPASTQLACAQAQNPKETVRSSWSQAVGVLKGSSTPQASSFATVKESSNVSSVAVTEEKKISTKAAKDADSEWETIPATNKKNNKKSKK